MTTWSTCKVMAALAAACSPVLGIYALKLALESETLNQVGRYDEAEAKATQAKKWAIWGIITGVLFYVALALLIYVLYVAFWDDIYEVFFQ